MSDQIRVGTILFGFCGGAFGREAYGDKRVEAVGADWVVARDIIDGEALFYAGDPDRLVEYSRGES